MPEAPTAGRVPHALTEFAAATAIPLTPTLLDFLDEFADHPHHRNVVGVFQPDAPVDLEALRRALDRLTERRDSLRLRLRSGPDGWHLRMLPPHDPAAAVPVETHTTTGVWEPLAAHAQASLDIDAGPVARVLVIDGARHRVVFIVHHLVADGLSWPLLASDLRRLYDQEHGRETLPLGPAGSFEVWARALAAREPETSTWTRQPWQDAAALPLDFPERAAQSTSAAEVFEWTTLDRAATAALQASLRTTRRGPSVPDLLLAALAHACDWADGHPVLLRMVGHGRPAWAIDALQDTTGWFSTHYPMLLPTAGGDVDALLKGAIAARSVERDGGVAFGAARWLGPASVRADLADRVRWPAAIDFNFLGPVSRPGGPSGPLEELDEPAGPIFAPAHVVQSPIRMTSYLRDGCLETRWMTSGVLWRRSTIHRMQQRFTAALEEFAR